MDLPILFLLKKFVTCLLLPPLLPWLIVIAGLLFARRWPRSARCMVWSGVIAGIGLSIPALVDPIMAPLEKFRAADRRALASAQAIVILAGGKRNYAPEFGGATVSNVTLERIRYGAKLARELKLPLLVTGGAPVPGNAEATLMAASLTQDFGITPRWVEDRSLDTQDNALYSQRLLAQAGITRIALVTHAAHMQRARNEFMQTGLEVIPAPTAFFNNPGRHGNPGDFIPSANGAYTAWYGLHEWLGLLAQRLREAAK